VFSPAFFGPTLRRDPITFTPPPASLPACTVSPLEEIKDPAALAFEEATAASAQVDTADMRPAAALALKRFQRIALSVGASVDLRSAYRPAAYQAHLQEVWEKWMLELRDNRQPQCQELRARVEEEFERHQLLPSQRPVTRSDHTLGVGFDAAVSIPPGARMGRRRVTIDLLARLSGIRRPDVVRDPVHFRLVGGRTLRS
jgi:hypothetical protein